MLAFRLPEKTLAALPVLPAVPGDWAVYLVLCQNGSLYCGIAKDPQRRWRAHRDGKGARYTRMHPPQQMRLLCCGLTAAAAARCEYRIKQLGCSHKRQLWIGLPVFQAA